MTNEHKPAEAEPLSGPLDRPQGHEAEPSSVYFSDTTLSLIGEEHAQAILTKRRWLEDTLSMGTQSDEEEMQMLEAARPHINNFYRIPGNLNMVDEMGKIFNLYNLRSRGMHKEADEIQPATIKSPLESLYLCYKEYNSTFEPIEFEKLSHDVGNTERAINITITTYHKLKAFFEDETFTQKDESDRDDDFYKDLLAGISQSTIAKYTMALQLYMQVERVMSQFERAEMIKGTQDYTGVLELVANQGFNDPLPNPTTGNLTKTPKYQSIDNLQWLGDRLHDRKQKLEPIEEELDQLITRFYDFMDSNRGFSFEEHLAAGASAIRKAEDTLHEQAETHPVNPDEFPFSLLDRSDDTGELFTHELEALYTLNSAPSLTIIRSEITQALTMLGTDRNRKHIVTAWHNITKTSDWENQVETARIVIAGVIERNLNSLMEHSRPAAQIIAGAKPRPPKKAKKSNTSAAKLAEAEAIYNQLHKDTDFDKQQMALIAAIASDNWEPVRRHMEQITDVYNQIFSFAENYGLQDAVTRHELSGIIAFAPDQVLDQIKRKAQAKGSNHLQKLSAAQRLRLEQVIAEMVPPEEQ